MARCDNCLANKVCDHHRFGFENCGSYISTADVAPKSEVEELEKEVERLTTILHSYALQYGTVTDKQAIINHERAEVAREIFKEIEKVRIISRACEKRGITYDFSEFYAELKKKYTEDENGTQ